MPELSAYFAYREQLLDRAATIRKNLAQAQLLAGYRALLEACWSLAGIAVVVELGDDIVRGHIDGAVEAASGWLAAPGSSANVAPSARMVDAAIDPGGRAWFKARSAAQPPPPAGSLEGWDIGVFSTVLHTLTAFGSAEQARAASESREEWYRSSEIARTYGIEMEEAPYLPVRFLAPGSLRDERR